MEIVRVRVQGLWVGIRLKVGRLKVRTFNLPTFNPCSD
jgi:hypothetical protein